MRHSLFLLAFSALGLIGAAKAQEPEPEGLSGIYACTQISDNGARLACFDQAAAALRTAEAEGAIKLLDLASAQQLDRESFGFSLPSVSQILAPKKTARPARFAPIENITALIKTVQLTPTGQAIVTLENGQVWRQVDQERSFQIKVGKTAKIAKGFGGGFLMSVGAGSGYRVRREQ